MNQLAESEKRIEENREIKYNILNSGWDINMLGLLIPDLPPIELKTLLYTDYKFSDKQKEVIRYYITISPYNYEEQPKLKDDIYVNKNNKRLMHIRPNMNYLGVSPEFLNMLYNKEVKVPEKFAIAFNKKYRKISGRDMFVNEQIVKEDTTDTLKKLINDIKDANLDARELRILAAQCEIYAEMHELSKNIGRYSMRTETIPLYIRFGEIPPNEKSKVHISNQVLREEAGVSVWRAVKANGEYYPVMPDEPNESAIADYFNFIMNCDCNVYLVTGDELIIEGADREPLLTNVKIIKDITYTYKKSKYL